MGHYLLMSITLALGGLVVALPKGYLNNSYPRVPVESSTPTLEYSSYGTPAIAGPAYAGKHVWTIDTLVNASIRNTLEALYAEFEYRRLSKLPVDILLYDKSATIKERLPRSRAIAPGSVEQAIAAGYVAYHAQFNAVFVSNLQFTKQGGRDGVQFTLQETSVVSA